MNEFTDHYEIVEENGTHIIDTFARAQELAEGNPDRIWHIRHGDEYDGEDPVWDVSLYEGQFVNTLGFFVSTEPCRPEHRDEVFTY